jgi:spermidine synthase
MLVVNLWGGDKSFTTLLQRIDSVFGGATLCLPAERPGNVIVFGFRTDPVSLEWRTLDARAETLHSELALEFPSFVQALRKMNRHDDRCLRTGKARGPITGRGFP